MDVQAIAISNGFPGRRKTRAKPESLARAAPNEQRNGPVSGAVSICTLDRVRGC